MALKKFAQTRWEIETQRVTLYPYRIFTALSIGFGIVFAGFIVFFCLTLYPGRPERAVSSMISLLIGLGVIVALVWAVSRTTVVFDNDTRVMRKKLFGLLSIRSEKFDDLQNIGIVRNTTGGYNFRAFLKRNKYGKGIVVSASYSKDDDPNAIALNHEAFTVIDGFLAAGFNHGDNQGEAITDFKYYTANPPYYTIKRNIGGAVVGLILIVVAVNELINHTLTHDSDTFHKVLVIGGFLFMGVAFIFGTLNKVIFDTNAKTVSSINVLGINNQTFNFSDFINFQVTRRTTNMIYSGTDVKMYFEIPGSNKQKVLAIKSFSNTKKIDRFLQESRYIMDSGKLVIVD